ncbi:nicotinate phosphoribosyltransferase [Pseudaeromonas sp. ZJS20]|uniref:nicotinate phosphoribosyltransferase n=1 Tax=Pseudaeromonas aegiceratis TaxID=3153928 RepID=UPI00390CA912
MSDHPCIQSLIDTDFYKLTMQQAYLHQLPQAEGEWAFHCRSDEDLTPYLPALRRHLQDLAALGLTEDEAVWLKAQAPYLSDDYLAFLRNYRFDPQRLQLSARGGRLLIRATGPQLLVSPLEIPVLATLSEVRNRACYPNLDEAQILAATDAKIVQLKQLARQHDLSGFRFSDFGTRRRFSFAAQERVVARLAEALPEHFVGTSNPHLARRFGLPCVGTMAHEWLQTHQGLGYRLEESQKAALENWIREYHGVLGVALTDVIGVDAFCRDLDRTLAQRYDGFRHDSGDPIAWGEKILARLAELDVDAAGKTLVFSDGLDFARAVAIYCHFQGRVKLSFGIGTWLMGDFAVNRPLNMVMKLVRLGGQPVAKISDSPGKTLCRDLDFLNNLMDVFAVSASTRDTVLANLAGR